MSPILGKMNDKTKAPGYASVDRDSETLTILCTGCKQFPDAGSTACIKCICNAVAENGTASRIRLRAGKDTEISGKAAELFCQLANIKRPVFVIPRGRKCARCPRSPDNLLESAWADFPDPSYSAAQKKLYADGSDGPECTACMQRTYCMLVNAEAEMNKIKAEASSAAGRRGTRA